MKIFKPFKVLVGEISGRSVIESLSWYISGGFFFKVVNTGWVAVEGRARKWT